MENKTFGDLTFPEIEKIEKDTNSIILFNAIGENAIQFSKTSNAGLVIAPEKDDDNDVFIFEGENIARLFNYLSDIINENPNKYNIITSASTTTSKYERIGKLARGIKVL